MQPSYPAIPGKFRRESDVLSFREVVFVGPEYGLSVIWRGKTRLTHGWEIRLLIRGEIALLRAGKTRRAAFTAFRRHAVEVANGASTYFATSGKGFTLAEIAKACGGIVRHPVHRRKRLKAS